MEVETVQLWIIAGTQQLDPSPYAYSNTFLLLLVGKHEEPTAMLESL